MQQAHSQQAPKTLHKPTRKRRHVDNVTLVQPVLGFLQVSLWRHQQALNVFPNITPMFVGVGSFTHLYNHPALGS
jgi:hypothetical protein